MTNRAYRPGIGRRPSPSLEDMQTLVALETLVLPAEVCHKLLDRAARVHETGLKSYGLFVGDPANPLTATDVIFLDSRRNRRNEPGNRAAFEAQGEYFRRYDDAGFVADPADLLRAYRSVEDTGLDFVGVFHSHRRQPANFSSIDFRLHNPAFAWHLIVSYYCGPRPELAAFRVRKTEAQLGISEHDHRQHSERSYEGPEVSPLRLVIDGNPILVAACLSAFSRAGERGSYRRS
jgi:proteasome lid subunit RPN8/RPN11